MNLLVFGLMIILGANVIVFAVWFFSQKNRRAENAAAQESLSALKLQEQMGALQHTIKDQMLGLTQQMNQFLEQNTRFLQETQHGYRDTVHKVQFRLGELQNATQSMIDIGKDIASLQQILKSPKMRGGIGELFLSELLRQILPPEHFVLQYGFQNGTKVDAVIILGQGLIPVDAKFPLENFRRVLESSDDETVRLARKEFIGDVKKHIDSIASKYILPDEGTFEFALMYIPAENIYYETIIKDDSQNESLSSYALRKHVVPVSPNSFYAYLEAIVRGLKGLRIEKSAQLILQSLGQLETDFKRCLTDFEKVGLHLRSARSAYENTEKRFGKLQDRLEIISGRQSEQKALDAETVSIE